MIRMQGVGKRYPLNYDTYRDALCDVDVTISAGEFVAVVGPSGSGKSTFLALAGLLDVPTSGELWLGERLMKAASEAERTAFRAQTCGFVFQFQSLVPTLTALENIMLPLTMQGGYKRSGESRAKQLVERVGLTDKQNDLPYQLSGGEQRRVAFARALIHEPTLILADEPTGALDDENAIVLMRLFHELHAEGRTIVMVTHDRQLASLAERTILLERGKVIAH